MLRIAALSLLALTACSSGASVNLATPAAQTMLGQPFPEYAAKLRLAQQIAASCGRYRFNTDMQAALTAARPDTANGRLVEFRQRNGVDLATDVEIRSFQAKHGVEVGVDNLCEAGDREVAEQTGISALLSAN